MAERDYYASVSDVQLYLTDAISIEGDNPTPSMLDPNPESMEELDVLAYINQAAQYIDSEISAIYMVPLKKVNMGGIVYYPPPIPSIAARLAAKFIWEQRLTGAEKGDGDKFIENHYKQALLELNEIVRGNRRLMGQNGQLGSRFSKASWHHIPPYPAKEPPQGQV